MHHRPTDPSCQYVDTSQYSPKRVGPLHKKNSKTEVGNYHLISILWYERVIYNQIESYLLEKDLVYRYRTVSSTDSCLVHLTKEVLTSLTWQTVLDCRWTRGTTQQWYCCTGEKPSVPWIMTYTPGETDGNGVKQHCTSWFMSYLSGRTQCVSVNSVLSTHWEIFCRGTTRLHIGAISFSDICQWHGKCSQLQTLPPLLWWFSSPGQWETNGGDPHQMAVHMQIYWDCVQDQCRAVDYRPRLGQNWLTP